MDAFARFGPAHLLSLAMVAAASWGAVAAGRSRRASAFARFLLAFVLAGTLAAYLVIEGIRGTLTTFDFLPFHLSDFAVLLAIFALITLRRRAAELLYFLAAPELLALFTPDVGGGFSRYQTIVFFVLHGGNIVAAVLLTFGLRLIPERGAIVRVMIFLNGYAVFAAIMNAIFDTNFLYLREKPAESSPLDWMGPWPWYLLTAEVAALVLFTILYLPFWSRAARARTMAA